MKLTITILEDLVGCPTKWHVEKCRSCGKPVNPRWDCRLVKSSGRLSPDGATLGPNFNLFCPACNYDDNVAESILNHWKKMMLSAHDVEYEFVHEEDKPKLGMRTYEVGIVEQHVSWRRVTVHATADRDEIIEAAMGTEEFRLSYDGLVEDAKEEIIELTPGDP